MSDNDVIEEVEAAEEDIIEEEVESPDLDNGDQEEPEGTQEEATNEESSEDASGEEEFSVTIGEEEEEEDEGEDSPNDSSVLKKMRNLYKEEKKKNRALKDEIAKATPAPVAENPERIKKPKLDDEDIDYDQEVYAEKMQEYLESESKHKKLEAEAQKQQQEANEAWQNKIDTYNSKKKQLEADDYDDAEEFVTESLSEVQQNVILQYAKDSALLVYALGKNKAKAQELAKITDPVEFAIQARELENKLSVRNRKKPPAPEKTVKGSSRGGKTSNKMLEDLRAKAEKTGDYTAVTAYKRKLQNKG